MDLVGDARLGPGIAPADRERPAPAVEPVVRPRVHEARQLAGDVCEVVERLSEDRGAPEAAERSIPVWRVPEAAARRTPEPEVVERRWARARRRRLAQEARALRRRELLAVGERGRLAVQVPAAHVGHAHGPAVDRGKCRVHADQHRATASRRAGSNQLLADRAGDRGEGPDRHHRRQDQPHVAE